MGSIRLPAGSFRVCLGSFTQPWSFGPYARQLTVLAGQLAKKHVVMWLALGYHDTEVRIKVPGLPENVGMLGGDFPRNQGVYVSSINALLEKHKMDVFISLMDLNRVFVDEMFSPLSISWFPNHFVSLDLHSRHALTAYDAVAVLGPSDATRVKEQLPHKHVMHIPHVIEDPGGLGETPRSVLRQKYGVPAGKFLALVNFANYDAEKNRKSIDLSLLAWKGVPPRHAHGRHLRRRARRAARVLLLHALAAAGDALARTPPPSATRAWRARDRPADRPTPCCHRAVPAFYEAYGDKALLYLHAVKLPTEGVHLPGLLHMSEVRARVRVRLGLGLGLG